MSFPRRFLPRCLAAALLALSSLLPAAALAAADGAASLPVLPPVPVIGSFANPASGGASIDRQIMEKLPAGNGSINELLGIFPDVQLAEGWRTTSNAGEILPPRFSIAGGKSYQNAFLLDGVANASLLDPAATLSTVNDIPGHPQALFPDAGLAQEITVFDSNIPARHGGFTGGVVLVETRDPGAELSGRLFYRTTRAEWTRFHLQPEEEAPAAFVKHNGGFELEMPLQPGSGLLAGYRQLYSRIPLRQLGETAAENRRKEDFFLKYVRQLPAATLRLALTATPYEAENVIANAKNSEYTIDGGGTRIQLTYALFPELGEWRTHAFYEASNNRREAPADLRAWAITDRHPWGQLAGVAYSLEGGFGDLDKEQEAVGFGTSFAGETLHWGSWRHAPEIGVEVETLRGSFERRETSRIYSGAKIEPAIICGDDDYACSDGEQYFTSRVVHPQTAVSARLTRGALYAEDSLRLQRLLLRPGVRISYDDFMRNLDVAPRLAASYDLFADGGTLLLAGYNRYYGQTLLTYKLREAQASPFYEYRRTYQGQLGDWERQADLGDDVDRFSRLATPYSDEVTAGLDQALLGGRLTLKYIRRDNEDEFAPEYGPRQADGLRVYTLTNRGESRHQSARLGWERTWARDFLSVNVTWQETTASNEDYDPEVKELAARVWFGDDLVYRSELPRSDYNRPWTVNLVYAGKFPYGLTFTNVARYRSGYRSILATGSTRPLPAGDGRINPLTGETIAEQLPVYEEERLADGIVFDWTLGWQSPGKKNLLLQVEIYNVFDARLETGSRRAEYEIGRQFWAGATWSF